MAIERLSDYGRVPQVLYSLAQVTVYGKKSLLETFGKSLMFRNGIFQPFMGSSEKHLYEFGEFRLDTAERLLLRKGEPVSLPPKVFDTLVVLVEHSGHLLNKDQLMKEVWPDAFVEDVNLSVNISALRKVLGASADGGHYIDTVPKRGYRFVAHVRELEGESDDLVVHSQIRARIVSEELETSTTPGRPEPAGANTLSATPWLTRRRSIVPVALGASVLVLGLTIAAVFFHNSGRGSGISTPVSKMNSMAVLPLKPLGQASENQYLELGIADDLITRLSHLKQVVIRPTGAVRKYTDAAQDPVAAGKELQVDSVLDGTIQKLGDRIRVTLRLVSVSDGRALWSGKFEENARDIFAVEDSISEQVAEALTPQLTGEERKLLTKRGTESPEAHDAYLKGRYFWNKRTSDGLRKAIDYFQRAIDVEPNYALAYSGLADCYALLYDYDDLAANIAVPKARAAALKAIQIDNTLAEPYCSLGYIESIHDWNWQAAEKEFKAANDLNPHYATGHHWYALALAFEGRFDESLQEIKRAQELDPFSLPINANMGRILHFRREYDQAIRQLQYTLELDSNFLGAHYKLAEVYATTGRYQEAAAEYEKWAELDGNKELATALGKGYAQSGYPGAMQMWLNTLQEQSKQGAVSPYALAVVNLDLGKTDQALSWLEKAADDRASWIILIKADPKFDSLRKEPRFKDLLRREGLEE